MLVLPKSTYRFFVNVDNMFLKFVWKGKGTIIAKPFQKKNKIGGFTLPYFKRYYEATLMMTVQYCQWKRHIDQCDRGDYSEVTNRDIQLIFYQVAKGNSIEIKNLLKQNKKTLKT